MNDSKRKHLSLLEIFSTHHTNHFWENSGGTGCSAFVPITLKLIKIAIMTTTSLQKSTLNT